MGASAAKEKLASGPKTSVGATRITAVARLAADLQKESCAANDELAEGAYYDAESGIFYNWNNYYDPRTGRWIMADRMSVLQHVQRWKARLKRGVVGQPLEINPYLAVNANPLRWTDPTGLELCIDGTWELLDEIIAPGPLATFVCKCRFICMRCNGSSTGITTDVYGTPTSPNWGSPNADWDKGGGGPGRPRPRPGDPTGCECAPPEGATGCKGCYPGGWPYQDRIPTIGPPRVR
jgi:RHS repeat-associated protein